MTVLVPIRTRNELNATRFHWRARSAWRREVHEAVGWALLAVDWRAMGVRRPSAEQPWVVRLVRLSPGKMDTDGVPAALKSVRDAFARFVGVDDRHEHIVGYAYGQEPAREHAVRIEVRRAAS